ncbi:MAG: DUF362 domain-containing protein [Candidatus Eisenbacteria bacterium]|nr:DUF362 domain-containing protein [Candidatus Eisenbacteria bacterium]
MTSPASAVYIRTVSAYGQAEPSVGALLEESGYLDAMAETPGLVVVKPNLIHAAHPDEAATTHPEVVRGVVKALQRTGHPVVIADSYSGAFPWSQRFLERVYRETGMADVARSSGCELSMDLDWGIRSLRDAPLGRIETLRVIERAAFMVNVPKLKTHSYTGLTCAVKNLFGVVPGHFKVSYHARFAEEDLFSLALRGLALSLPVMVTVVDAVTAMEGEGPAAGDPRPVGALMAGGDLLAVDRVAARFCGLDPASMMWLGRGDGTVVGPQPEELVPGGLRRATPHRLDMGVFRSPLVRSLARRLLKGVFSPAPAIVHRRCVRCIACIAACPVEAMTRGRDFPKVDRRRCIRCYCCHEACRSHAIVIRPSPLGRFLA